MHEDHTRQRRALGGAVLLALGVSACAGSVIVDGGAGGAATTSVEGTGAGGSITSTGGFGGAPAPAGGMGGGVPTEDPSIIKSTAKITRVDAAAQDSFGEFVAISGDSAVVGCRFLTSGFAFRRTGAVWTQEAELVAEEPHQGIDSVAVDGDTMVTATTNSGDPSLGGEAYVFRRNGGSWKQEATLTGSDTTAKSNFGKGAAISGDTVVIGADRLYDGLPGAAYVFVRDNGVWSQQAKLTAADATPNDRFGYSVAISGDTIAVSLDGSPMSKSSRIAYVYTRSGGIWHEEPPLMTSPTPRVAYSVALSGDTLIAGDSDLTPAAYIFARAGGVWAQQATLEPPPGVQLGFSVAVSGDFALVGGPSSDLLSAGEAPGNAYVFTRKDGAWSSPRALVPNQAEMSGSFGLPVAVSGNTAIVGAMFDREKGKAAGAAFVFTLTP